MIKDLISVIVPVYNGEGYIKRCIESIEKAAKELPPLVSAEIIIINDGSTDGTDGVCRGIIEDRTCRKSVANETCREGAVDVTSEKNDDSVTKTPEISVITLNDEGVSVGRNRGIKEAKGEYITFVDADDIIAPTMLKCLYNALLSDENMAFAGCGFFEWTDENVSFEGADVGESATEIDGFSAKVGVEDSACEVLEPSGEDTVQSVQIYTSDGYIKNEILKNNTRCWSKLYRISFIKNCEISFRNGLTIGEDMLFLTQLVKKADAHFAELKGYKGYGYYKNANGVINRKFTPAYMDQILCWELMEKELKDPVITRNKLVGIMLTASKIAQLPKDERKENESYVDICHEKALETYKNAENQKSVKLLDMGYKFKLRLFLLNKNLYMKLYHIWKSGSI